MILIPGIGLLHLPLLKIPLVLTSSAIAIAGGTPHTPPASKAMKTKYKGRQDILCSRLLVQAVLPIHKVSSTLNLRGSKVVNLI